MIIFDIETGPVPIEELDKFLPAGGFVADKRLKDPIKIREDLQSKLDDFYSRAALDATTGRVLAIGYKRPDKGQMVEVAGADQTEAQLIAGFWDLVEKEKGNVVGYNIAGFDLPFLIRRSWKLGIKFPLLRTNRYYWSPRVIDLMEVYTFSFNRREYVSLDTVAKHLGIGQKTEGINGGDFAGLWNGSPDERAKAIEYLKNDVELTYKIYQRLCC